MTQLPPNTGPQGMRAGQVGKIEKAGDARSALSRLLPYLQPFRAGVALVLGFVVLYTALGLVGPYLMGVAIDRLVRTRHAAGLAAIALWMLTAYVFGNALQVIAGRLMASISQRALKQLRQDLFSRVQSLPVGFFDRNPAGDLLSRLTNDIDAINQAISQNVTTLVASLLSMAGILGAMFILNRSLALASLVVVPIMFWFTQFVARYTRKGFRDLQRDLGQLNGVMEEAISGQRVLHAFRRKDSAVENFRQSNAKVYQAGVYANSYALLLMPITSVLGNLFVIVLAGLGGFLALSGLVTVGIIATFISYGQNFVQPLRQLANLYNSIQAALAGAERIFAIIDVSPEPDDAANAPPLGLVRGAVRFEHVRFSYVPKSVVLQDLSFEAKPGQVTALVGPTGAGKTTIINLLTRFYEIDSGRITVDGRDIRELGKADLRRHLGLVLQDVFLFSGSVLENIRYGRLEASDAQVMEAAKLAEADPFIRLLPRGYQTALSERANNLSQGQRQLIAIARAILADPAILILDEATSSVDTRTEARIQSALLRLMKGRTSFVIAHRLSTIADADQVLVIDAGAVVERGKHAELLAQQGVYARLYSSQFKGEAI
ncbi:MAG TPA: ABC transporter ATP-binding protein [Polyangiaceae bacterium]|jgi:ATP-binding cassette subfamily B multidrug efflux pump|nr:ABC transporter ATP-binding protein [Polyangiaceae bacterium]